MILFVIKIGFGGGGGGGTSRTAKTVHTRVVFVDELARGRYFHQLLDVLLQVGDECLAHLLIFHCMVDLRCLSIAEIVSIFLLFPLFCALVAVVD